MKFYRLVFFIAVLFLFTGCGEDEEGEESEGSSSATTSSTRGWHFEGRDCLACHNVDLGQDKHLSVAGTLFKSASVSDVDDLANSCNADIAIEFLDSSFNKVYSTADYYDANSKGNKGQGNIFLLDRLFNATLNGAYTVRIVDRLTGLSMAQSNANTHSFSGAEYSISSAEDFSNRLSCNACHNGGTTSPLYVQSNSSLCK